MGTKQRSEGRLEGGIDEVYRAPNSRSPNHSTGINEPKYVFSSLSVRGEDKETRMLEWRDGLTLCESVDNKIDQYSSRPLENARNLNRQTLIVNRLLS